MRAMSVAYSRKAPSATNVLPPLYQKQPCWNLHSNVVECICWEREQKHMLYLFYPVQVCQFYPFYPFYPLNYFIRFIRMKFYPGEVYPDEILSNPDETVWLSGRSLSGDEIV